MNKPHSCALGDGRHHLHCPIGPSAATPILQSSASLLRAYPARNEPPTLNLPCVLVIASTGGLVPHPLDDNCSLRSPVMYYKFISCSSINVFDQQYKKQITDVCCKVKKLWLSSVGSKQSNVLYTPQCSARLQGTVYLQGFPIRQTAGAEGL